MRPGLILLGSIGVLAETSDIQRRAYNATFEKHGLDWRWDRETYQYLLKFVGGQARMRLLSNAAAEGLSDETIAAIHADKTRLAGEMVAQEVTAPRPGIQVLIEKARGAGVPLGIVTSTQMANITAIAEAAKVDLAAFDVVITQDDVPTGKPHPAPYLEALERTGVAAKDAIAVEDTSASLQSAVDAGIETIVTPGAYAADQDFRLAAHVVPSLLDDTGALIATLGV